MANRRPLALDAGQVRQVQQGDTLVVNEFPAWDTDYDWDDFQAAYVDLAMRNSHRATLQFEFFNHGLTVNAPMFGGGVLASSGNVYFPPLHYNRVVRLDPSDDSLTAIGPDYGLGTPKWNGGCLAPNGIIYSMPAQGGAVLKIDTSNENVSTTGNLPAGGNSLWATCAYTDGKVYAAPVNTGNVGVLDVATETTSNINIATANGYYPSLALGPDGNIHLIPRDASNIGMINTANDAFTTYGSTGAVTSPKFIRGAIAPSGLIICAPASSETFLFIRALQQASQSVTAPAGTIKYSGVVPSSEGMLYFIPRDATTVTRMDARYDGYFPYGGITGSDKWYGGRLALNSFIYCPPASETRVMKIKTADEVPANFALSKFVNYF